MNDFYSFNNILTKNYLNYFKINNVIWCFKKNAYKWLRIEKKNHKIVESKERILVTLRRVHSHIHYRKHNKTLHRTALPGDSNHKSFQPLLTVVDLQILIWVLFFLFFLFSPILQSQIKIWLIHFNPFYTRQTDYLSFILTLKTDHHHHHHIHNIIHNDISLSLPRSTRGRLLSNHQTPVPSDGWDRIISSAASLLWSRG